jgi:hypothetical protein
MKTALLLCSIFLLEVPVASQPETAEVITSTKTCLPHSIPIMGVAPTDVVISTHQGYRWVEIDNLSGSFDAFCNERTNVSTSTTVGISGAGVKGGRVKANTMRKFMIKPFTKWYCVADGTSALEAVVCKGR